MKQAFLFQGRREDEISIIVRRIGKTIMAVIK